MSILETIKAHKFIEVSNNQQQVSVDELKQQAGFDRQVISISEAVKFGSGIIAEFKRASPSKGNINLDADVIEIVTSYAEAGVSAISVLTDQEFFQARPDDITKARAALDIPILRKEFIVDSYQIYEAKALGADAILLIAAILDSNSIDQLTNTAHELGLEVLIEVHDESELEKLCGREHMVGVNNRNLNDFSVDLNKSIELMPKLPSQAVKIAESGITGLEDMLKLKRAGFQGFLIGEHFMKSANVGQTVLELKNELAK
jgi:indole-3-glycerol phosphate synthase